MKNVNNYIRKLGKYILDKRYRFLINSSYFGYKNMSDKEFLEKKFKYMLGYDLNLENPTTFNEKLQWLKLYDRCPEYTTMVDKFAVKKYMADKIGEQYIIPTLGVWDKFDDIDFDKLPKQFVLKCTHDSGGLVIVKDKQQFDKAAANKKLEKCLKRNYYWSGREWPYKNVSPKIIAEQYLQDSKTSQLNDYKFLCFEGRPEIIEIHQNRYTNKYTQDFYDINWRPVPISQGEKFGNGIFKPQTFELMLKFSASLSEGFHHLRIDWYEVNGKLYFGELTFYDGSGFVPFDKIEYDEYLGSLIKL